MATDRQELFKRLWAMCNDVRGAVEGWDFRQYVYGALFYRYLSEQLRAHVNEDEQKFDSTYDFANETDAQAISNIRTSVVNELGYFIEPQDLFCNLVARGEMEDDLNITLSKIFEGIMQSAPEYSQHAFSNIFGDIDMNSTRLGSTVPERNKRLMKVLRGVEALDIPDVSKSEIDVFGDMFEFLASKYAANAGKAGGEFYTPQEVSELLAGIVTYGKTHINKGYDMCCGSGSLLLRLKRTLDGGSVAVDKGLFGQEINVATYNLCRMNMLLHGVHPDHFKIACGDTLTNHQFAIGRDAPEKTEPFDAIVSNPPYSISWEGKDNPVLCADERFNKTAMAPKGKADMAFVLHALSCLSESGTAAIVCFPGVLYRSGAEAKIREYLVTNNFVDAIIQLPEDMFFGTTIATCILVLRKSAKPDSNVLFIDASGEFERESNRNVMNKDQRKKVMDVWAKRESVEYFSKLVSMDEIKAMDYNLTVGMYVEKEDTREVIDIDQLEADIAATVKREDALRQEIDGLVAMLRGGLGCA